MLLSSKSLKRYSKVKAFNAMDVKGEVVCFPSKKHPINVLIVMCNHCPYVKRILTKTVDVLGAMDDVFVVAISSNDATSYPEDSPEKMLELVNQFNLPWPYIYDEDQAISKNYQAECTPEFYVFHDNKLYYHGAFDTTSFDEEATGDLIQEAIMLALKGECLESWLPAIGCSIKWKT